jgi:ornithine carbamoyltransferase
MALRHFLDIADWSSADIAGLIELGHAIHVNPKAYRKALDGLTLGMIFQKKSTRTRVSFEVGMVQLGGHALFLSAADIQIGRGETIADTAKVLSRYCDGIMARVYGHSVLEELAAHATIPIINGLSDRLHPCQTMADALTLAEHWSPPGAFDVGVLRGRKLTYVGDGNNMAHSLLNTGAVLGMDVTIAAPRGYWPDLAVMDKARARAAETGARLHCTTDPFEAVRGADAVYTDVWASMGQEDEAAKRLKDFQGFMVDSAMMAQAKPDAVFLHCLPAHRGEEVSAAVCDGPQSIIFDEAENRLHAQKAILVELMSER